MLSMEHQKPSTALFDVFLRLRPGQAERERFLDVEETPQDAPTHITIKPPANDKRKRAIERFAFTRVFEENAGQREIFETSGAVRLLEGVLGASGREGSDGLLATLGVTGSGKVLKGFRVCKNTGTDYVVESHNPRIQDSAWSNPADSRCALSTYRAISRQCRLERSGLLITLLRRRG